MHNILFGNIFCLAWNILVQCNYCCYLFFTCLNIKYQALLKCLLYNRVPPARRQGAIIITIFLRVSLMKMNETVLKHLYHLRTGLDAPLHFGAPMRANTPFCRFSWALHSALCYLYNNNIIKKTIFYCYSNQLPTQHLNFSLTKCYNTFSAFNSCN